jgi:Rps23 Pro-64 3,4-dihydroxylase Tpa1-like proline 4-hydroxylase
MSATMRTTRLNVSQVQFGYDTQMAMEKMDAVHAPVAEQPTGGRASQLSAGSGEMSKEQKKKFIGEIKAEMKEMVVQICTHQVDDSTKKMNFKLDQFQKQYAIDLKNTMDKFEQEMLTVSDYCKKRMEKIREEFAEDIRSMQKLRARDRSDYDQILNKIKGKIKDNKDEIDVHATYFETFANAIALLTENINMQMEGEFNDVRDRNLMGLYGIQDKAPI